MKQRKIKQLVQASLSSEAVLYGSHELFVMLTVLFNPCLRSNYLPNAFMQFLIVPLIKNKTGDLSDPNNYRAIALSTAQSKIFESILSPYVISYDNIDDYQYGFQQEHSTTMCTNVLKTVVNYYVSHGSQVFTCFIDFQKPLIMFNYWKLLMKLLDDVLM